MNTNIVASVVQFTKLNFHFNELTINCGNKMIIVLGGGSGKQYIDALVISN